MESCPLCTKVSVESSIRRRQIGDTLPQLYDVPGVFKLCVSKRSLSELASATFSHSRDQMRALYGLHHANAADHTTDQLVFPTRKDISEEVIDLISGVEIVTSVR
jgi:hypothetical protein